MTWTLTLLAVLSACTTSMADPKPEPSPKPDIRFERDMMMRFHMQQNFDLLRAMERLLIRGKLSDARQFATAIATAPDEPAHGPWATYMVVVRDRAAAVARATDVSDAIRKVAAVGAACGKCHSEHVPKLDTGPLPRLPVDRPTLEARMARHRWAADRLWEGVVSNDDGPWRAGLDVLAAAPFEIPADRAPFARTLQRAADQARRPSPGPLVDRATTYGEILVTCAKCHTAPAGR